MTKLNDMARDMRSHTISGAGPAKLVDFAIDRTLEAYTRNSSSVEHEFRQYMIAKDGRPAR